MNEEIRQHALLSASGSHRWIACPPSARLEEQFPDVRSAYAEEGTLAHNLSELHLKKYLGCIHKKDYDAKFQRLSADPLFSPEMMDNVDIYVGLSIERINEARSRSKDALILVEQRLDFSDWVPDGFGTGDLVIVSDGVLEIIDLKYGKGVPVSAEGNTQMMLYGLGALNKYSFLYDISTVRMTICQPRLDSISVGEITVEELLVWAKEVAEPKAQMAMAGEGEFNAGEHCRFCRAKHTCRARAEANLELAKFDFTDPSLLADDEMGEVLAKAELLQSWVSDVWEYAQTEAVAGRKKWTGFKVVEGRSVRKYADEMKIAQVLVTAGGYTENDIYSRKLIGITDMEKMLGRKKFNELLAGFVEKPPGRPTLVRDMDERSEWNAAAADFD
jgi:hypothetical protein